MLGSTVSSGRDRRRKAALLALLITLSLLAACSPSLVAAVQSASWLEPEQGLEAFQEYGCDTCHTVTERDSTTAISLVDLSEKETLSVGVPATPANVIRYIQNPQSVHPQATMPNLGVPQDKALEIAIYLYSLTWLQLQSGEPYVSISATSGPPGTVLTVEIRNFPPETATRVGVGRAGESFLDSDMALTDADGAATAKIAIPATAEVGEQWVVMVHSMGDEPVEVQSSVFTVTGPALPVLSLVPGFGPPGTEVSVRGRDFAPETSLELTFGNLDSPPAIEQTVQTDAEGRLALTIQVPDSAAPGQTWLAIIVLADDGEETYVASPEFLVTQPQPEASVYVIQVGDTLSGIASRFGITLADILAANPNITNPNRIMIGQTIRLPGGGDATESALLLPDLQPLPAGRLTLEFDAASGARQLRYSTTVTNVGDGPLHMLGDYDAARDRTRVTQVIATTSGGSVERVAGYFVHHPEHGHWHYENFNTVELWTFNPDGSLGEMVATTGKVTFCISDMSRMDSPPPNAAPNPQFTACGRRAQGISVGWEDTYGPELPGQQINITDVPDGRYALRTVVNPDGLISEIELGNNTAIRYIEIEGQTVRPIPPP
jgi:LysM repeat protein